MRLCALIALVLTFASSTTFGQPAGPDAPLTRIAFGSCADQNFPQPIWADVLAYQPQLFIFAGDNVYGDRRRGRRVPESEVMDSLREAYETARHIPSLMALRQTVPHLATWDDHDIGRDDGGSDSPHLREAKELFLDFWEVLPSDPRRSREGVYHTQMFGPEDRRVQVILLDTRSFRSPWKGEPPSGFARTVSYFRRLVRHLRDGYSTSTPDKPRYIPDEDPSKTMLGEAQWIWLEEQLRQPAQIRLIVSSIQVLSGPAGQERWGNFPRERQRLFDVIRSAGAKNVVFLSGDRHGGAVYQETDGTPYPLNEITASGLNRISAAGPEAGPPRIAEVFGSPHFGTIEIDWDHGTLTLSLRGENGQIFGAAKFSGRMVLKSPC